MQISVEIARFICLYFFIWWKQNYTENSVFICRDRYLRANTEVIKILRMPHNDNILINNCRKSKNIYTEKNRQEENEVGGKLWWGKRVENDSVQTRI